MAAFGGIGFCCCPTGCARGDDFATDTTGDYDTDGGGTFTVADSRLFCVSATDDGSLTQAIQPTGTSTFTAIAEAVVFQDPAYDSGAGYGKVGVTLGKYTDSDTYAFFYVEWDIANSNGQPKLTYKPTGGSETTVSVGSTVSDAAGVTLKLEVVASTTYKTYAINCYVNGSLAHTESTALLDFTSDGVVDLGARVVGGGQWDCLYVSATGIHYLGSSGCCTDTPQVIEATIPAITQIALSGFCCSDVPTGVVRMVWNSVAQRYESTSFNVKDAALGADACASPTSTTARHWRLFCQVGSPRIVLRLNNVLGGFFFVEYRNSSLAGLCTTGTTLTEAPDASPKCNFGSSVTVEPAF